MARTTDQIQTEIIAAVESTTELSSTHITVQTFYLEAIHLCGGIHTVAVRAEDRPVQD